MKAKYTLTVLSIILSTISFSQWTTVPSPFNGSLYCVKKVNNDIAFVGGSSKLLKTIDGGNSWTVDYDFSFSLLASLVNDICFTDTNTGYIVSNAGKLIKTTDQGQNWTALNSNNQYGTGINAIDFSVTPFSTYGFLAGVLGQAAISTTDGSVWMPRSLSTTKELYDVKFFSGTFANVGFAVGKEGTIRRTVTSGNGWFTIAPLVNHDLKGIATINDNIVFVVGHSGTILRSNDRGQSWNIINSNTTEDLNKVCFKDSLNGYIVGDNGKILKTIDGGFTWLNEISGTNVDLYDIDYFNDNYFIVGLFGTILKKTIVSNVEEVDNLSKIKIYPNPSSGQFTISLEEIYEEIEINITSLTGKVIKKYTSHGSKEIQLNFEGSSGTYIVNISNSIGQKSFRIIKN